MGVRARRRVRARVRLRVGFDVGALEDLAEVLGRAGAAAGDDGHLDGGL